ncbi:MAG: transposase zinc-binding domain-containing protein [Planctomycetaceae bacterium]
MRGRLPGGFARLRCPKCRGEHLLAFSCRTRNFCASCQEKRAALLSEHLETVLARVPHRHWVFTIPRALRQLFARERSLLALLPRCAFAAVCRGLRERAGLRGGAPGFVASIQTFGAALRFHPHVHALAADGLFLCDGTFVAIDPDPRAVEEHFRRLVIGAFRKAERLLSWERSGSRVYPEQVGLPAPPDPPPATVRRRPSREPPRRPARCNLLLCSTSSAMRRASTAWAPKSASSRTSASTRVLDTGC